jgi:hypothetical protein
MPVFFMNSDSALADRGGFVLWPFGGFGIRAVPSDGLCIPGLTTASAIGDIFLAVPKRALQVAVRASLEIPHVVDILAGAMDKKPGLARTAGLACSGITRKAATGRRIADGK